ncbi:MAG: hypothetical protein ACJAXK_001519 [Yoonia sp.]|jgi:hypothetical protein
MPPIAAQIYVSAQTVMGVVPACSLAFFDLCQKPEIGFFALYQGDNLSSD